MEKSEKLGLRLILAIDSGNFDYIESMIRAGADPNITDIYGHTALTVGNWNRDDRITELLINNGADVNLLNGYGRSPLQWTASRDKVKSAQLLIEAGADINAKDNEGRTALNLASYNGYNNVMVLLLKLGADINTQDNAGRTPLYWGAWYSEFDIVNSLVSYGADMNIANRDNCTPLYVTLIHKNKTKVARYLIQMGANVNLAGEYGYSPLHLAAERGSVVLMEMLISRGAELYTDDLKGNKPLDILKQSNLDKYNKQKDHLIEFYTHVQSKRLKQEDSLMCTKTEYAYDL